MCAGDRSGVDVWVSLQRESLMVSQAKKKKRFKKRVERENNWNVMWDFVK